VADVDQRPVFKPTKVFITEEEVASVKKPGIKVIWSTSKF
jgi:hypothetical protein